MKYNRVEKGGNSNLRIMGLKMRLRGNTLRRGKGAKLRA